LLAAFRGADNDQAEVGALLLAEALAALRALAGTTE
jgi:hypothetical protein